MTHTGRLLRERRKFEQEQARKARHANRPAQRLAQKRKRLLQKAVAKFLQAEKERLRLEGKTFTVVGYRAACEFARQQAEKLFERAEEESLIIPTALAVANAE